MTAQAPVPPDEYLYFLNRAFGGMLSALVELGEPLATARPALDGANSAYSIVFHCAEVAEYWIGHVFAGRPSARDRAAEFAAAGTLDELRTRIDAVTARIRADLLGADFAAPPSNPPEPGYEGPERPLTRVGVLLHVLEELAQHHGQVQLTRDLLLAGVKR
ncbi:DUF664 domain-containing protein [Amycolatopsis cynarae]|uniref:DUF664 domain-containing protein n=1 Tax=Amycolatopsis cynarae TaxID=2995223 RepID=A0ABY7B751_9PSEU|nr:DUF664 domain-containing protein [Amycolatopsis sp. HUAS 11-8]WAL68145.1 DUF664 domain-containing protein [Amycolatopsis sp. HUAS 11-8]